MTEILDDLNEHNNLNLKERHGCVTAWLALMIVTNLGVVATYFAFKDAVVSALPNEPSSMLIYGLGFLGLLNIVFAVLLFQWKKIGFFGFAVSSVVALGINLALGLGITECMSGLLGIALLFAVLQIKNKHKVAAWELLE